MFPKSIVVRRYLVVLSVLTLAAILTSLALRSGVRARSEIARREPATLGQISGFQLVDQTGASFGSADLAGSYYLADFIFTSCAGVCPTMTSAMAGLYRAYQGDARIRFVSITVDPETDTPQHLAEFAARYGADADQWKFLTGDIDYIAAIARDQFLLGSADEPINHSSRFVLVDGSGAIRGFYDGTDPESIARLQGDLAEFLPEVDSQH